LQFLFRKVRTPQLPIKYPPPPQFLLDCIYNVTGLEGGDIECRLPEEPNSISYDILYEIDRELTLKTKRTRRA